MSPQVGPFPGFLVGWVLAAVLAGASVVWLMQRAGFTSRQIWFAIGVRAVALLAGSKLLYLIEAWPAWAADPSSALSAVFSEQMRIPGGILLVLIIGPWLARATGISYLRLADAVAPAGGLLIFGIRIGCLLEGCCHGLPSHVPWAMRFPAGTEAHVWQVERALIPWNAPFTAPVHPLQLYFGLAGLFIFATLTLYQECKRFEGEILLLFALLYLWSSWLLEFLRARPHALTQGLTLAAAVTATLVAVAVEWRLRTRPRRDDGERPHNSVTVRSR